MVLRKFNKLKIDNEKTFKLTDECYDAVVVDVVCTLLKHVIETGNPIQYGELSKKMNNPINPRNLDRPLGIISDACKENGLPLISVMVVNKQSFIPGAGFFKYFYPGLKENDWDAKFVETFNQVMAYPDWKKVLDEFSSLKQ